MKFASPLLLAVFLGASTLFAGEIVDEPGKHLDICQNGKPLVRYMYAYDTSTPDARHETYKVYHHVLDTDGEQYLTKGPGGQYTHHRGIFIGWSRLEYDGKRHDTWHMKGRAAQVHQRFVQQQAGEDRTIVSSIVHWLASDGETVMLEETRTVTVDHTDKEAYLLLDFVSQLKAVGGEVVLNGDPEHAGCQYRPHNDVSQNKSARYTFHEPDIDPKKDRDLPWVAEDYLLRDKRWSVQHMNHADNPKGTIYSAYRPYGRFGAFATATIPDGQTLTLRYRIRIVPGETPAREVLAEQYDEYVGD